MIKGHAVIELKDETTGKIWRTEHDNMITNGLKYALTPWLGKFSYANTGTSGEFQVMTSENKELRKSQNRSIMNHLLGGIFLFQNPLTEDVDNVAFPNDNPLTGKASWDAYSGMDTSRGSYNESESGMQEDGSYKHVWDFNTQQANGQISALSLTTYMGGICGDGFADWNWNTENAVNGEVMLKLGGLKLKSTGDNAPLVFSNAEENTIYYTNGYQLYHQSGYTNEHIGNSGKLILEKIKAPLTKISPFYDYYNQYVTDQIEISIPSDFVTYVNGKTCKAYTTDSYVYIWREYWFSKDDNVLILRINKSGLTTDVLNITFGIENVQHQGDGIIFTDKYIFFIDNKYNMYRFRLANNDLSTIENVQFSDMSYFVYIAGYIYTYPYANNGKIYCINEETLEVKAHPAMTYYMTSNNKHTGFEKIAPNIYLKGGTLTNPLGTYISAHIASKTLMTINNLSSPVTKTASQSMKITYTIQETDTEI